MAKNTTIDPLGLRQALWAWIKLIDALQDFRQAKIENKRLKADNNKLVESNKDLTMENDDLLKRLQTEDYYQTAIQVIAKENQHLSWGYNYEKFSFGPRKKYNPPNGSMGKLFTVNMEASENKNHAALSCFFLLSGCVPTNK